MALIAQHRQTRHRHPGAQGLRHLLQVVVKDAVGFRPRLPVHHDRLSQRGQQDGQQQHTQQAGPAGSAASAQRRGITVGGTM